MGPDPLVTVVITNHNYEGFVGEAIASALAQGYPHLEVVVVDDGSTDGSREVIASFGARVVAVFQENGGQAAAFNAGVRATRGELVAFLDADDFFYPEKVEHVVRAWRRNPGAWMYYHPVQRVDAGRAAFGKPIPTFGVTGSLAGTLRRSGGWYQFPPTSGLVFPRRTLDALFPLPTEEIRLCADAFLVDAASFLGPVCYVSEPLSAYRIHGANGWITANAWSADENAGGIALDSHLRRHEVRNRMLNDFLARNGQPTVDIGRSFARNELVWQARGMPFGGLLRLLWEGIRFPAFTLRQRAGVALRLPLRWARAARAGAAGRARVTGS